MEGSEFRYRRKQSFTQQRKEHNIFPQKDYKELMVIGGGQIYEMALPVANKVWLTRVHTNIDGDTFFPNLGTEWHKHTIESHHADEKHAFDFDFECWQRK